MSFSDFNINPSLDCCICTHPLANAENGSLVSCVAHEENGQLHPMHRLCLINWVESALMRPSEPTCPICRTRVTSIDNINVHEVEPSAAMTKSRHRAILVALRQLRASRIFLNPDRMIQNTMQSTLFQCTDKNGHVSIVSCSPMDAPSPSLGPYAWSIRIQRT